MFSLDFFFSYFWVDMEEEYVKSVLWGRWFLLCLCLMYENHERNSIGCGNLFTCHILWVMCLWLA